MELLGLCLVFFFVRIQRKSLLHFCRYSRFFLIVLQKKWPLCVGQERRETKKVKLYGSPPRSFSCQVLHNCQNLLCTYVGQEETTLYSKESEQHSAASSAFTFGQSSKAGQEHRWQQGRKKETSSACSTSWSGTVTRLSNSTECLPK